ncbi:MAG: hypothetical protein ABSD10_01255 [Candidatus Saccharimonadales bacterium]|jgi:hypothetical protein
MNKLLLPSAAQRSAYFDFEKWTDRVRRDVEDWVIEVAKYRSPDQLPSDMDAEQRYTHRLLISGCHWYDSLRSPGFNKQLRGLIKSQIRKDVEEAVRNLRNLKEHWRENKKYFDFPDTPIPANRDNTSAIWLRKQHPKSSLFKPPSPNALLLPGYYTGHPIPDALIAGCFNPKDLLAEVDKFKSIVDRDTTEHQFANGRMTYRY